MSHTSKKTTIVDKAKQFIRETRDEVTEKPVEEPKLKKDIVLYVGKPIRRVTEGMIESIKTTLEGNYRLGLILDRKTVKSVEQDLLEMFSPVITCDFGSKESIIKALKPYQDEILTATCRTEKDIPDLQKVLPHLPYIKSPTSESLTWTTDKITMRQVLAAYDKTITPQFAVIEGCTKKTIAEIEDTIGFPVVCKPAGLASSMLVSIAYHPEELEEILKKTFKKIESLYKERRGRGVPKILVEQFLEGELYSTDAYVTSRGKITFSPFVHIKTGAQIGFDDFFGYRQMTPTRLSKASIEKAEIVASKAIRAVGLRSSAAHIELLKTEDGWKIVELGPRLGGFRHELYKLAFGIDSGANDILVRIPKPVSVPKKPKGYATYMKFFAKKEGKIVAFKGIKKIEELKSLQSIMINKKVGDMAKFAKHGGGSVINLILFNEDRAKLLADIRRFETTVEIEVK